MLLELNQTVHDALDELWTRAMEAITSLDVPGATERWAAFVDALTLHAHHEDTTVLPIYAAHGEFPRGGALDIMESEHEKLGRLAEDGRNALPDALRDRRVMIAELHRFQRVHQVLEHHTLREQTLVYPTLTKNASVDELEAIRGALQASLG